MEIIDRLVLTDKVIEKLRGNGQCKCDKCGQINWTDWCFHYDGLTLCDNCIKKELEDDIIVAHANAEQNKILYADRHLRILELQREERQDLKNIIKAQNDELAVTDFYNAYFNSKRG